MVKKLTIEDPATSVTDGRKLDECTYLRGDVKKVVFLGGRDVLYWGRALVPDNNFLSLNYHIYVLHAYGTK